MRFIGTEPRLVGITISGAGGTPMLPFLGLSLGDEKQKVLNALGNPSKIEPEPEQKLEHYIYGGRNYSVELDESGRLASIQLLGYRGFNKTAEVQFAGLDKFRDAILSHDVTRVLAMVTGDLQLRRAERGESFGKSARTELSDPGNEFAQVFFNRQDSLFAFFRREKYQARPTLRYFADAPPQTIVDFDHNKIIKQMIFRLDAGEWKLEQLSLFY